MSGLQKFSIITALVLLMGAVYVVYQTRGDTTVGVTLTTNPNLEDGLVGHWTFDGPDVVGTTTAIDRSTNGNDGTLTNGPRPVSGTIGQALHFTNDGSSDEHIDAGFVSGVEMGTGDLAVAAWVKMAPTQPEQYQGIVTKGAGSSINEGYMFSYRTDTSKLLFWISDGSTRIFGNSDGDLNLTDDSWHYVVVNADRDGNANFYVDGVSVGGSSIASYDGTDITNAAQKLFIARWSTIWDLNGSIDDVRIYNRLLSTDEIQRLYDLGNTTRVAETITTNPDFERGLTGHWTFDGPDMDWSSTTAEVQDRAGGYDADAQGDLSSGQSIPGRLGQALDFDGTDDQVDVNEAYDTFISTTTGSIAAWIRPEGTAYSGDPTQIRSAASAVGTHTVLVSFGIVQMNNTDFGGDMIWAWNFDETDTFTLAGVPYTSGEWMHVVWVHDDDVLSVYKNGVFASSTASTNTDTAFGIGDLAIGSGWSGGAATRYWEGGIDDVRTYSRALSAAEIKRLYELGATTKLAETITTNPDLETGLVGHWTFDGPETNLSTSTDRSGNDNDGTLVGGVSQTAGAIGQALDFDGTTGYVQIASSSELKPTGDFAVAFWYKGVTGGLGYFLSHSPEGSTNYWYIDEDKARFCGAAGCTTEVSHTYTLPDDNNWHHIAAVLNPIPSPDELSVYIDGVLDGTSTDTRDGGVLYGSDLRIGGPYWAGNYNREGPMDDVRIYNRTLSAGEVKRLYELGS